MTLCVFALVASEFLPVSLLTPIAGDLGVSEGLAGYGIAISGAFAVLASLSITRLAGNMDRKLLLLLLTGLMGVSGLIVGLAPNYQAYLLGRALIGVVVGGFWSMSAAVAMRLVPAARWPGRWRCSMAATHWRLSSRRPWAATWAAPSAGAAPFCAWYRCRCWRWPGNGSACQP